MFRNAAACWRGGIHRGSSNHIVEAMRRDEKLSKALATDEDMKEKMMHYTSSISSYDIDLSRSELERWSSVILAEYRPARALMREMARSFEKMPWALPK
jgi:hypothetical protein